MTKRSIRPEDFPEIKHSADHCFLCGSEYGLDDKTAEHIFPEWLLHRFDLWDQQFTFPNGQTVHYRKIKIPCCRRCNTGPLARLERTVERAVRGGYRRFRLLHHKRVFQWLSKILFEVMYLDARWLIDHKQRDLGTVLDPEELKEQRTLFMFLQSVRIPMQFAKFRPWSLFVFETEVPEDPARAFDYVDNPQLLTVAIRMGDIGVIAVLQDNGAIESAYCPLRDRLREEPISPIQFREAAARVWYARSLINRTPKYLTLYRRPVTVLSMPLQGISAKPIFDPFRPEEFAGFLSWFCQVPREECYSPERGLLTYLGPPPHNSPLQPTATAPPSS